MTERDRSDEWLAPVIDLPVSRWSSDGCAGAGAGAGDAAGTGAHHDADPAAPLARVHRFAGRAEVDADDDASTSAPDPEAISMRMLDRRGVSARELRDRLVERGVAEHDADDEVARLAGVGLIDDESLAAELVDRLRERKGLGRTALIQELKRRKLDPVAINAAVAVIDIEEQDSDAHRIAASRARSLTSLAPEVAERRLLGFLARRGHSGEIARRAARDALAAVAPAKRSGPVFR